LADFIAVSIKAADDGFAPILTQALQHDSISKLMQQFP